jgi:UDP:flavonoid glycosyltransferase YjiC (YdhE family)
MRKLIERGHRVRLLSDACNRTEAESIGAEFVAYRHAPSRDDKSAASDLMRDWEAVSPQDGFVRILNKIMCGPALDYARDVLREIDRKPTDAIVSSEMLFGVMAAAEARQQRLALLTANLSLFPIPGLPPFGPGLLPAVNAEDRSMQADMATATRVMFNSGLPAVNAARAALGLPPAADLLDHIERADRIFLGTSRAFDFEAKQLPANLLYIGPQLDDPVWAAPWISPWREDDERPLIVVAFSTTFQDHAGTIQRVIDALAPMPGARARHAWRRR